MNRYRACLHGDAFFAMLSGVMCVFTPHLFVGQFYTEPLGGVGLAFVRLLGTVYAFYAVLEWVALARADRRFWAVWLPAALSGDAMHMVVWFVCMREASAIWGFGAWFNCAFMAFFMPLRVYLIRNVHLLDRAPDGVGAVQVAR